jgi:hypothetical protein
VVAAGPATYLERSSVRAQTCFQKEKLMRDIALRFVWRGAFVTVAVAIIAFLSLAAYCAVDTATYVSSSQQFAGTVIDIEKPVFENHRNDFRPVVEATLPSGESFKGRFSGLYRVSADSVGQPISLLYNSTALPTVVPDSPLNWIGSIVYGGISFTLMMAFGLLWFSGRWIPPAQTATTRTEPG